MSTNSRMMLAAARVLPEPTTISLVLARVIATLTRRQSFSSVPTCTDRDAQTCLAYVNLAAIAIFSNVVPDDRLKVSGYAYPYLKYE